jgi:hypothetical protein
MDSVPMFDEVYQQQDISTSPNGSGMSFDSPALQELRFSDDVFTPQKSPSKFYDETEQTPPLFMQPIIRKQRSEKKHNVLIVTDFTFPKFGGVETHGY